ncbi:hypothetical protein Esti_003553 [Eimeria stiedai]
MSIRFLLTSGLFPPSLVQGGRCVRTFSQQPKQPASAKAVLCAFSSFAQSSLSRSERSTNSLFFNSFFRVFPVDQRRFVARVRVHRFAGVVPLKVRAPKSEWYIQAEKEFLSEREQIPDGYIERWREEDLAKLDPAVRESLSLRCASNSQIHKWRKLQLCRQLQRRPFDTGSSAVQIACLTENILNARQHLLRHRRDHTKKRILSIWLARRHRAMKYLYRTDYDLYKLTCNLLRYAFPSLKQTISFRCKQTMNIAHIIRASDAEECHRFAFVSLQASDASSSPFLILEIDNA